MDRQLINRYFNGMRSIGHLYILFLHYLTSNLEIIEKLKSVPVPLLHLNRTLVMYIFVIFFVINGYYCGRRITNKINKTSGNLKIFIKFYIERLAMILPTTYLYILAFMAFIHFRPGCSLFHLQMESLTSNLLFLGNFFSLESNVSCFSS